MSMPSYNGAANADDPLVTPWNIAGWTAQAIPQDSVQVAQFISQNAPFPSNLIYVQVEAPYYDFDMNPLSGFLTFQTSEDFTVTSGGFTYRIPQRYAGVDNAYYAGGQNNRGTGKIFIRNGLMSVTLMATQNVAIVTDSGNPLTYHVVEHFLGGQQYNIAISDGATSPVDLRSLIVTGTISPYDYDPANPGAVGGYAPLTPSPSSALLNDIDGGGA